MDLFSMADTSFKLRQAREGQSEFETPQALSIMKTKRFCKDFEWWDDCWNDFLKKFDWWIT